VLIHVLRPSAANASPISIMLASATPAFKRATLVHRADSCFETVVDARIGVDRHHGRILREDFHSGGYDIARRVLLGLVDARQKRGVIADSLVRRGARSSATGPTTWWS